MTGPSLLPKEMSAKLSRLKIVSKSSTRGAHKGSHRSNRFGSSLDFSDYRVYHPGDDVRQIDWNVFARTEKHFIKRFLDEQEMSVHILLDATKSMNEEKKWLVARQLTSAIGQIVLAKDDTLSFHQSSEDSAYFRKKGRVFQSQYAHHLEKLHTASSDRTFTTSLHLAPLRSKTILYCITDGLESLDQWEIFLKNTARVSRDIRVLFIHAKEDIVPLVNGDVEFISREEEASVNVTILKDTMIQYTNSREAHFQALESLLRKHGASFLHVSSEESIHHILFTQLIRANWLV
ncbi:DUF58 domain-containing protein [Paenisporosarcina cavernae]|uniref:DUF58 domain-containing protein n=1 Tax=Paenisporosarcina cavernae TaxID=2320858 RepID=A0A385YQQ4_9BACL|nr:DUF58 domain-containing protein [Paenisporosarcina cavernae]AYC29085.1 DUF58 domain-containing protein [Paenisporosarcina cavernae]